MNFYFLECLYLPLSFLETSSIGNSDSTVRKFRMKRRKCCTCNPVACLLPRRSRFNDRANDCPSFLRVHVLFSFVVSTIPTNQVARSDAQYVWKARKVLLFYQSFRSVHHTTIRYSFVSSLH